MWRIYFNCEKFCCCVYSNCARLSCEIKPEVEAHVERQLLRDFCDLYFDTPDFVRCIWVSPRGNIFGERHHLFGNSDSSMNVCACDRNYSWWMLLTVRFRTWGARFAKFANVSYGTNFFAFGFVARTCLCVGSLWRCYDKLEQCRTFRRCAYI
jgi:hypothetical protein